jgi:hypothetical protein
MRTMPVVIPRGTKVVFAFPENGYPADRERLKRLELQPGAEYTVDSTEVHSWSTSLRLREFPGEVFNTVNFALASQS